MVNSDTSFSKRCMVLIRMIVLECMRQNVRVFAKHVPGVTNKISDSISRGDYLRFRAVAEQEGRRFNPLPTPNTSIFG